MFEMECLCCVCLVQIGKVLSLKAPKTKIAIFANSGDSDEVAHHEPPLQSQHCLSSSL